MYTGYLYLLIDGNKTSEEFVPNRAELVDPNTHNNKLATYHSWFAIPFSRNERMPINVPRYLHLDLSKHVMRNISRFRLRAHTLKVEAAA